MPVTVIAELIGRDRGTTVLKDRVREPAAGFPAAGPGEPGGVCAGEIAAAR
jgi:hypothetical protein